MPKYKKPKLRTVKVGEFVNIPEKICKLLNISNGNNLQVVGKVAAFPCYVFYYFATPEGRSIKEFVKTDIEQDIAQNLLPSLKTDTKVVEYNFLSGIVDEHHDDFEKESAWLYRAED